MTHDAAGTETHGPGNDGSDAGNTGEPAGGHQHLRTVAWRPWSAHGVALVGCVWLAFVVNDWLRSQLLPLLQLGLQDTVPFRVPPYAVPLALSALVAAVGWWAARADASSQGTRWVVARVLESTGWAMVGFVVSLVGSIVAAGDLGRLVDGELPPYGTLSFLLPLAVATALLVLGYVVEPRRSAIAADGPRAPSSLGAWWRRGMALVGCVWVAWVVFEALVLLALPALRVQRTPALHAVLELAVQLVAALVVAAAGWALALDVGRGDARARLVTSHLLDTGGWVLAGLAVADVSWLISSFGWDTFVHSASRIGVGPETYLVPLSVGVVVAFVGSALRSPQPPPE